MTSVMYPLSSPKLNPASIYLCQPRPLQIIQLVEGPPPPPTTTLSPSDSDSDASSSYYTTTTTSSSSSQTEDPRSSYCSSQSDCDDDEADAGEQEAMGGKMDRVSVWQRETFGDRELLAPTSHTLSGKNGGGEVGGADPAHHNDDPTRTHSCPACDATFYSCHDLRSHGRAKGVSEACCAAVAYTLE